MIDIMIGVHENREIEEMTLLGGVTNFACNTAAVLRFGQPGEKRPVSCYFACMSSVHTSHLCLRTFNTHLS